MITITPSAEMLIRDFLEQVYKPARLGDVVRGTIIHYEGSVNTFGRWLGREPTLADLNEDLMVRWLTDKRKNGWAAATCNARLRPLLTMWRYAKQRRYPVPDDDLNQIQRFREPLNQPTAWTEEEMGRLIDSARLARGRLAGIPANAWWVSLILTLYDTGLRRKAAFGIRVDELDFTTHILRVPAERMKNRVEQYFRLHPQTMEAIADSFPPRRQLLFPFPFTHHLAIYDRLRAILRRAGLPATSKDLFHTIRRTTASHIARVAGEAMAIQQLGHRDQSTIRRYVDPRFTNNHNGAMLLGRPGLLPSQLAMLAEPAQGTPENKQGTVPYLNAEAPPAVEPAPPSRPKPVAIGSGRPQGDPDLIDSLRVKSRLTWADVRKALRTLLIPPSMFALELKTPPGPLAELLKSKEPLTPLWDQRIRLALGLNHPAAWGKGVKRGTTND
jgi:integrase